MLLAPVQLEHRVIVNRSAIKHHLRRLGLHSDAGIQTPGLSLLIDANKAISKHYIPHHVQNASARTLHTVRDGVDVPLSDNYRMAESDDCNGATSK